MSFESMRKREEISFKHDKSEGTQMNDAHLKDFNRYEVADLDWSLSEFNRFNALQLIPKNIPLEKINEPVSFTQMKDFTVMLANQPFVKTSKFFIFAAMIIDSTTGKAQKCVAKESIFQSNRKFYEERLDYHAKVSSLAEAFSKIPKLSKKVSFFAKSLIILPGNRYLMLEEFFDDYAENYTDFDNNNVSNTLNSFSHWAHEKSGGEIGINGFLGFQKDNKLYILDSVSMFGARLYPTMSNHECNEICAALHLKKNKCERKLKYTAKAKVEIGETVTNDFEVDVNAIKNCKNENELKLIGQKLIQELEEIEIRKKLGYDTSEAYDNLKIKFELAKKMKDVKH